MQQIYNSSHCHFQFIPLWQGKPSGVSQISHLHRPNSQLSKGRRAFSDEHGIPKLSKNDLLLILSNNLHLKVKRNKEIQIKFI